jgi:hypothetical protein
MDGEKIEPILGGTREFDFTCNTLGDLATKMEDLTLIYLDAHYQTAIAAGAASVSHEAAPASAGGEDQPRAELPL